MIDKEALYKAREDTKNEILEKLKTCDRFGVVRPQGFGKTYIITELCKELPGKKLIIEPTEGINEYIEQFGLDKSVDCIIYHSLLHNDFNPKELLQYDYIFLDEMHRALAPNWGSVLKETLSNFKGKIIGFSATPIRGDGLNSVQKLFDGEQISELSLVEAIIEGLLPQPTYVTGIYEIQDKDIKNIVKNETLAKQFYDYDLNNNLEFIFKKYLNLTPNKCLHIIVFCHRISDIKKAKANMEKWIDIRPVKHYEVHSDKHKEENQKAIKDFESATTGLNIIYSANMLNEGIHPKKLDAVVFLRKTKSNVIYNQQLGRVISEYLDNSIVFDLVNNVYNLESSYILDFKIYAKKHNIKYEDLKTKLNEPLKIYEEQKDLIDLLASIKGNYGKCLTAEQVEYINNNRLNYSIPEIANHLNTTWQIVYNYLKRHNLSFKKAEKTSKLSKREKDYINNHKDTKLVREIAKELNIDSGDIYYYLRSSKLTYKKALRPNYTKESLKNVGRNFLTEEDKEYINMHRMTKNISELAADLNRNRSQISLYLARHNLPYKSRNRKLTEEEKEYIDRYKGKKSLNQLAADLNKKRGCIHYYIQMSTNNANNADKDKLENLNMDDIKHKKIVLDLIDNTIHTFNLKEQDFILYLIQALQDRYINGSK